MRITRIYLPRPSGAARYTCFTLSTETELFSICRELRTVGGTLERKQHYRQAHQRGTTPCHLSLSLPSPDRNVAITTVRFTFLHYMHARSGMQTSHRCQEARGVSKATLMALQNINDGAPPSARSTISYLTNAACAAWKTHRVCLHKYDECYHTRRELS